MESVSLNLHTLSELIDLCSVNSSYSSQFSLLSSDLVRVFRTTGKEKGVELGRLLEPNIHRLRFLHQLFFSDFEGPPTDIKCSCGGYGGIVAEVKEEKEEKERLKNQARGNIFRRKDKDTSKRRGSVDLDLSSSGSGSQSHAGAKHERHMTDSTHGRPESNQCKLLFLKAFFYCDGPTFLFSLASVCAGILTDSSTIFKSLSSIPTSPPPITNLLPSSASTTTSNQSPSSLLPLDLDNTPQEIARSLTFSTVPSTYPSDKQPVTSSASAFATFNTNNNSPYRPPTRRPPAPPPVGMTRKKSFSVSSGMTASSTSTISASASISPPSHPHRPPPGPPPNGPSSDSSSLSPLIVPPPEPNVIQRGRAFTVGSTVLPPSSSIRNHSSSIVTSSPQKTYRNRARTVRTPSPPHQQTPASSSSNSVMPSPFISPNSFPPAPNFPAPSFQTPSVPSSLPGSVIPGSVIPTPPKRSPSIDLTMSPTPTGTPSAPLTSPTLTNSTPSNVSTSSPIPPTPATPSVRMLVQQLSDKNNQTSPPTPVSTTGSSVTAPILSTTNSFSRLPTSPLSSTSSLNPEESRVVELAAICLDYTIRLLWRCQELVEADSIESCNGRIHVQMGSSAQMSTWRKAQEDDKRWWMRVLFYKIVHACKNRISTQNTIDALFELMVGEFKNHRKIENAIKEQQNRVVSKDDPRNKYVSLQGLRDSGILSYHGKKIIRLKVLPGILFTLTYSDLKTKKKKVLEDLNLLLISKNENSKLVLTTRGWCRWLMPLILGKKALLQRLENEPSTPQVDPEINHAEEIMASPKLFTHAGSYAKIIAELGSADKDFDSVKLSSTKAVLRLAINIVVCLLFHRFINGAEDGSLTPAILLNSFPVLQKQPTPPSSAPSRPPPRRPLSISGNPLTETLNPATVPPITPRGRNATVITTPSTRGVTIVTGGTTNLSLARGSVSQIGSGTGSSTSNSLSISSLSSSNQGRNSPPKLSSRNTGHLQTNLSLDDSLGSSGSGLSNSNRSSDSFAFAGVYVSPLPSQRRSIAMKSSSRTSTTTTTNNNNNEDNSSISSSLMDISENHSNLNSHRTSIQFQPTSLVKHSSLAKRTKSLIENSHTSSLHGGTHTNTNKIQTSEMRSVILDVLDEVQSVYGWDLTAAQLVRLMLRSLFTKILARVEIFKDIYTHVAWISLFELLDLTEEFIFYTSEPIDSGSDSQKDKEQTRELGIYVDEEGKCSDEILVQRVVGLLQKLSIESDHNLDAFQTPEEKAQRQQKEDLRKHISAEKDFWIQISEFFHLCEASGQDKKSLENFVNIFSLALYTRHSPNRKPRSRGMFGGKSKATEQQAVYSRLLHIVGKARAQSLMCKSLDSKHRKLTDPGTRSEKPTNDIVTSASTISEIKTKLENAASRSFRSLTFLDSSRPSSSSLSKAEASKKAPSQVTPEKDSKLSQSLEKLASAATKSSIPKTETMIAPARTFPRSSSASFSFHRNPSSASSAASSSSSASTTPVLLPSSSISTMSSSTIPTTRPASNSISIIPGSLSRSRRNSPVSSKTTTSTTSNSRPSSRRNSPRASSRPSSRSHSPQPATSSTGSGIYENIPKLDRPMLIATDSGISTISNGNDSDNDEGGTPKTNFNTIGAFLDVFKQSSSTKSAPILSIDCVDDPVTPAIPINEYNVSNSLIVNTPPLMNFDGDGGALTPRSKDKRGTGHRRGAVTLSLISPRSNKPGAGGTTVPISRNDLFPSPKSPEPVNVSVDISSISSSVSLSSSSSTSSSSSLTQPSVSSSSSSIKNDPSISRSKSPRKYSAITTSSNSNSSNSNPIIGPKGKILNRTMSGALFSSSSMGYNQPPTLTSSKSTYVSGASAPNTPHQSTHRTPQKFFQPSQDGTS